MKKLKQFADFLYNDLPKYRITFFVNLYNLINVIWYTYMFYQCYHTIAGGPEFYFLSSLYIFCINLLTYLFFPILLYNEKTGNNFFKKDNPLFKSKPALIFMAIIVFSVFSVFYISTADFLAIFLFPLLFFFILFILFKINKNIIFYIFALIALISVIVLLVKNYLTIYMPHVLFLIFFVIEYKKQHFIKKDNPVFNNKLYRVISAISVLFVMVCYIVVVLLFVMCSVVFLFEDPIKILANKYLVK